MKNLPQRLFALLCAMTLPVFAQPKHPAQMTFKVIDDAGAPVPGGTVRASTFSYWERGEGFGRDVHDQYEAQIDNDGVAVINGPSLRGLFYYAAFPEGKYYSGSGGYFQLKGVVNGRWEPWNPKLEIIVPRILDPVPLYVRRLEAIKLPVAGQVGFDLMISDWMPPHGKGKRSDFIFEVKNIVPVTDPADVFESILILTFTNPGDGIQSQLAQPKRRLLELPRRAPEAGYEPKLSKRIARTRKGAPFETGTREEQNYFFRVRAVTDANGKVVSALYGKIHGDIIWDTLNSHQGHLRFTYYLNPTENDRNLEFDPKRNLFSRKLSGTNVTAP